MESCWPLSPCGRLGDVQPKCSRLQWETVRVFAAAAADTDCVVCLVYFSAAVCPLSRDHKIDCVKQTQTRENNHRRRITRVPFCCCWLHASQSSKRQHCSVCTACGLQTRMPRIPSRHVHICNASKRNFLTHIHSTHNVISSATEPEVSCLLFAFFHKAISTKIPKMPCH